MKHDEKKIEGLSPVRVHPDKTPIYHQGDNAQFIFRVNSGVVMTFRYLLNGERQITGFCTEGDFFGLSPNISYQDAAITVTSAGVQSIAIETIQNNPDMLRKVMSFTYKKVEDAQNLLVSLTKTSSEARVAAFIIMLAERKGTSSACLDNVHVKLPMSRLDIADYLGLSRETVSRRLTDFQVDGLIDLPNVHTAYIPKMKALRARAGVYC